LASRGRPAICALLTAITAVAIEVAQRGGGSKGAAGDLFLGRHFDPWDLLAYALGIALAIIWDKRSRR
jgi:hypothetical protein